MAVSFCDSRIQKLALLCVLLSGCQSVTTSLGKKLPLPGNQSRLGQESSVLIAGGQPSDPQPLSVHDQAELHAAMSQAAEKRGDREAALKAYQRARELGSDKTDTLHRMAVLHDKQGESVKAEELYEAVLAQEPENYEAHCDYGYSLYLRHEWDKSDVHLREAIRLKPDLSRARNILAMKLARSGHVAEAMAEFARGGVPQAEAHANIALAMILEGKDTQAKHQMTIAASLESSARMKERLDTYRQALKGLEFQLADANVRVASHATESGEQSSVLQHKEPTE